MASGRIPREFIDDLLTRADVVDVINARVPLKKKGREYGACCPFHNEKTPSFTVSPSKQFYHCFGCGVHGSAITFLMEYEHLDFVEAVESLADSMGVIVPREQGGKAPSPEQRQSSKDLFSLLEEASNYYQLQLKNSIQAVDYLKHRDLSGEICKRFNIGYSLSGWDHTLKHFANNQAHNYSEQQLVDSGLVIKKDDGKIYDRYRDRIMFPIRNRKGQVIGFGGRVLGDELPKYINSPETTIFHKGRELYGLYEARKNTQKLDRIIVVEGYMDVIALAQFDISYAVATLGTATTQDHIKQLFRAVPEIIFCFDGDRAGREAAWRALENAMPVMQDGKEIRFLFLPDDEDPDTQVRKIGKEAFEENYKTAASLISYFVDTLHRKHNISSQEGKASFILDAGKYLKTMPDNISKVNIINKLADLLNVPYKTIEGKTSFVSEVNLNENVAASTKVGISNNVSRISNREVRQTPVRYAISLLLNEPSLISNVQNIEEIALSKLPGSDLLTTLIEALQENPNIKPVALLDRWKNTEYEAPLAQLMKWQPESEDFEILKREFLGCIEQIRRRSHESKFEDLLHVARNKDFSELTDIEKQAIRASIKNRK